MDPRPFVLRVLLLGFWNLGLYMVVFLIAIQHTSPAEGAIILATSPIFTHLCAVIVKQERFSPWALVGAIIALGGVSLVVLRGTPATGESHLVGNLMMLGAAAIWSIGAVYMRTLMSSFEPGHLLALSMPGALPALLSYTLLSHGHTNWTHVSGEAWLMLLHTAILSGAIGFMGFYVGVKKLGSAGAMLYQYFVPPLTMFMAYVVLRQAVTVPQICGVIIVLLGVWLAMTARERTLAMDPSETSLAR